MAQTLIAVIQQGGPSWRLDHTPGSDVAAGALLHLGGGFYGIATAAISSGRLGSVDVGCIARIKKATGSGQSYAVGAPVRCADIAVGANVATGMLPIGMCVKAAATTDDGVLTLLNYLPRSAPVVIEHHTADDTLTVAESGSTHTNLGASGAITFTLPQDATAGIRFEFKAMAAQELRVDPGAAGAVYVNGAKQTDNKYISFDDEAESVVLTADGNGDWVAGPTNGTISVEA